METGTATSQSTVPRVQLLMLSKQEIEKITSPHIPEQAVQNDKPGMPSLCKGSVFCIDNNKISLLKTTKRVTYQPIGVKRWCHFGA